MRPQTGRATTDQAGLEKPRQESTDDRDARLESAYSYDLRGERSTLAFVSVYRDELTQDFFDWRSREDDIGHTTGETFADGFRRWEVSRFGSRLDLGPHGVLWFQVRIKLTLDQGGRWIPNGYFDRKPPMAKRLPASPEVMVDKLSQEMEMPHVRKSKRQIEERIRELDGQAAALRAEAEKIEGDR